MNSLKPFGISRREALRGVACGFGGLAMGAMAHRAAAAANPLAPKLVHHAPKAKRVIYLFMSGGPSHLDLWDYKPKMREMYGKDLPKEVRDGQRITGMTSRQKTFPAAKAFAPFQPYCQSRTPPPTLLPRHGNLADDVRLLRPMHPEATEHDPPIPFFPPGHQHPRPPTHPQDLGGVPGGELGQRSVGWGAGTTASVPMRSRRVRVPNYKSNLPL